MNAETKTVICDMVNVILPVSSEDDPHEFALIGKDGSTLFESCFDTYEYAVKRAGEEFPNLEFTVRDITQEWLVEKARIYVRRIKKLKPSFRKTNLTLDMSKMYYSRTPNSWETYIPFSYKNRKYAYIENASKDFIREVN